MLSFVTVSKAARNELLWNEGMSSLSTQVYLMYLTQV